MAVAYFDHANASPLLPEAKEAMLPFLSEEFGSPSSVHRAGAKPLQALTAAREQVAALINCRPDELVFESSGSEANNHA
ncbi:aminotransferase class V-fold PLP-dependent enzyme, partial [candidate division WOR-3 bacterium]|nr:aminotransferase class V-fold PLP-dependent enzyme [candidate division WOR-3 bacterium]